MANINVPLDPDYMKKFRELKVILEADTNELAMRRMIDICVGYLADNYKNLKIKSKQEAKST